MTRPAKPDRAERLAAQLRANLSRRKQQARVAGATPAADPSPDDQRASATDPSDVATPAA
jgi:hypothetical protein